MPGGLEVVAVVVQEGEPEITPVVVAVSGGINPLSVAVRGGIGLPDATVWSLATTESPTPHFQGTIFKVMPGGGVPPVLRYVSTLFRSVIGELPVPPTTYSTLK